MKTLVVIAFVFVVMALWFARGSCVECGGTGWLPCPAPSCRDGCQYLPSTQETRPCPVCLGHQRIRCPFCTDD